VSLRVGRCYPNSCFVDVKTRARYENRTNLAKEHRYVFGGPWNGRIRKAILDSDLHIPEGTTIGYDAEADRQRYFVTESGITVVTRDYSLFKNPVTVDYLTSE
jgi:hypothetical protein